MNIKSGQEVFIMDEVAEVLPDVYKVEKVVDKLVTVNGPRGRFRIHRSRISTIICEEKKVTMTKEAVKKDSKKTKKKVDQYDLSEMKSSGTLLSKGAEPFPPKNPTMKRESLVWISEDGSEEKVFNLYGGSLGKRGKEPKSKLIDKEKFPDAESCKEKWVKRGYKVKS